MQSISGRFMAFTHAVYTVRMVQLVAILKSESLFNTWLRLVLDTPQIGFIHLCLLMDCPLWHIFNICSSVNLWSKVKDADRTDSMTVRVSLWAIDVTTSYSTERISNWTFLKFVARPIDKYTVSSITEIVTNTLLVLSTSCSIYMYVDWFENFSCMNDARHAKVNSDSVRFV